MPNLGNFGALRGGDHISLVVLEEWKTLQIAWEDRWFPVKSCHSTNPLIDLKTKVVPFPVGFH